jgi:hypothetical protein
MVQSSGRFKTTHTGCYLSAQAYGEVHRFETALYGALLRGQSKKRYPHARSLGSVMNSHRALANGQERHFFKELKCYHKGGFV